MRPMFKAALVLLMVVMLLPIPLLFGEERSSGEAWSGSRITFADVPTGTNAAIEDLVLQGNEATDVVVLDASLWLMFRGSDHSMLARYHPICPSSTWNISFEAYAPRTGNSYPSSDPGRIGVQAMLSGSGGAKLGVELCVGNHENEGVFLIEGGSRKLICHGILPAYPSGNTSDGGRPDRYVVSFERVQSLVRVMVRHTSAGILLNRAITSSSISPSIEFYADSEIETIGESSHIQSVNGGWMMDDFTIRSAGTAYPVIRQVWCTMDQAAPVRVGLVDAENRPLDAEVSIAGQAAQRRGESYEAFYERPVDWSVPTTIEVHNGPVSFKERLLVTTTSSAPGAKVANWWNGWDWASVLATDDCSGFSTVARVYRGFNHPLTAYVESTSGNANDVLATQSELAMHYPHDFLDWKRKNWSEAVTSAELMHSRLKSKYAFASRWDDPAYVGNGDTYISLANPGNAATYEIMFAQFLCGTRIEGSSSNQWDTVPGNCSIYGSWWLMKAPWWDSANHSWQPARPMDLMDAQRQFRTDHDNSPWTEVKEVAARGGLLRVYNHEGNDPMSSEARKLVYWIVAPKSNFSFENWKTTDGEAASYVYARHTTAVRPNATLEMGYDVSRRDPQAAGYWLVPATISIDLGMRQVRSVKVVEHSTHGDITLELQALNDRRVMDVGYDIREDTLHVSHFFNASATIVVDLIGDAQNTNLVDSAPLDESPPSMDRNKIGSTSMLINWPAWTDIMNLAQKEHLLIPRCSDRDGTLRFTSPSASRLYIGG